MKTSPSVSKHVLVATPVLLLGGTEMQTLEMVRVLVKNGYDVTICCYYEYNNAVVDDFRFAGATVQLLKLDRLVTTKFVRQFVQLFLALLKVIRSEIPDVVHVQYLAPGLIPIFAAKMAGVKKVFATVHYPRNRFGNREKLFVRLAAKLCTMFFCNSVATEESWFGTGTVYGDSTCNSGSRHCTLYNSVDIQHIEECIGVVARTTIKKELGITRRPVVGVVARLRSEKGHSFLLHAMKRVAQTMPRTVLLIIGDGPDKSELQALAENLLLVDNVRWLGSKPHEEILALYGIMDIVAVPSEYEGFGLSAAEAMAAGVPVVASDVGGLREVVDAGTTGLLVPYGAADEMSEALLSLLRYPASARRMGKLGREKIERQFSLPKYSSLLIAAYNQYL